VALQRPLAEKKRQQLELLAKCHEPVQVEADAELLRRVLQNLIGNALKFTPAGGHVSVEIACAGNRARLSVRDDGPGIPAELEPRLFQEFAAGDQPGRGSGLGLAFCRLAVEAHGGTLVAERGETGGAVFRVELAPAPS
jgi:signal transduction histidine kinase